MTSLSSPSKSQVVLVTGASSGVGEATARRLAASGHRVVLGARRTIRIAGIAQDIELAGGQAICRMLDVTRPDSFLGFVERARREFGRIDVLVNAAGFNAPSPMEALQIGDWDRTIDVNLRGVLHGIAAVLPVMREQRAGHIVNVVPAAARRLAPATAMRSATEAAVRALSEGLARECRHLRVTTLEVGGAGEPAEAAGLEAIAFAIGQPERADKPQPARAIAQA
ncbi:MAG TPA: SDR family oxidoreductase [Ideonella sp.]|nr:SDR family oxidoreductase [Ideonella sp.]